MAETAEELSASTQCADSLPSDDVAMHRMCGWALKSMKDNLVIQAAKSKMAGYKDHAAQFSQCFEAFHHRKTFAVKTSPVLRQRWIDFPQTSTVALHGWQHLRSGPSNTRTRVATVSMVRSCLRYNKYGIRTPYIACRPCKN